MEFSEKMTAILNYGALNLAMGIGYQTGLFDAMDDLGRPETADAIAAGARLDPRYVREWLGIMVCGGIVELSADDDGIDRFSLPKAHGDLITRRAGENNLGVYAQEIPLLTACAMESVVHGFRSGQGIDYEHYPAFQAFMGELADAKHQRVLIDQFLPSIDDGQLCRDLERGIAVCDLGCGQGLAAILMARAYPNSRFTGLDVSQDAIEHAAAAARREGLSNLRFLCRDAADLRDDAEFEAAFDYITAFDAIHDQTRPLEALQSVKHMLAPGGRFSMIDITADSRIRENKDHPMGPFLYTVSLMHCMPVGLAHGGMGLGMMWGRQRAVALLAKAGFQTVELLPIPNDAFNTHYMCRNA
jgi:SAM-dependent methyltransferase